MKTTFLGNVLATMAISSFVLAPLSAFAGDHDKDKGKSKGHWNPAPPKKNGRHDNRDWNKGNSTWRSDDRRGQDWQRQQEWQRQEDLRRQQEWQRQQQYQRSTDWNRNRNYGVTQQDYDRRQQKKNEWRNLAIGAGVVSILGLLKKDNTLTFAGAAGALYSLYRYEQDRKSQSAMERGRAYYFSQPYFYRDNVRYDRRTVTKNGQRYYQFVRH